MEWVKYQTIGGGNLLCELFCDLLRAALKTGDSFASRKYIALCQNWLQVGHLTVRATPIVRIINVSKNVSH